MTRPWLARYCADPDTPRLWQSCVHAVSGWSMATDSRGILAIHDGGYAWPLDADPEVRYRGEQSLRPYLETQPRPVLTTTLDDLAAWCEYVEWCPCGTCGGESPSRGHCDACDPQGRWLPSPYHLRPGLLAGIPIDRNRLGWMLAAELWDLGEDRTVCVGTHRGISSVVILDGARWRLVLMGVDADRHADAAHEARFDHDPLFRHLWLDREDEAGACALADWRMERES